MSVSVRLWFAISALLTLARHGADALSVLRPQIAAALLVGRLVELDVARNPERAARVLLGLVPAAPAR